MANNFGISSWQFRQPHNESGRLVCFYMWFAMCNDKTLYHIIKPFHYAFLYGPFTRCTNCGLRMHRECREHFPRRRVKRSVHYRRIRNPQFCGSGKRPMVGDVLWQDPVKYIEPVAIILHFSMMTSSNGNIIRVTGHLVGEFTGPWWFPRTKASGAELWSFLWSASE